ncbi:MAG: TonB-dependent receptor [Cytophagales bacterium]|nr:TonB-dependent receptor [Cytophagales bacterium]
MKKIYQIFLIFGFLSISAMNGHAQSSSWQVRILDETGEGLPGANVQNRRDRQIGVTNINGIARLKKLQIGDTLIASFTGYQSAALVFEGKENMVLKLKKGVALKGVVIQGKTAYVNPLKPILSETITSGELKKAACCDLSESFETNASVDVGQSDAATGAKKILFLGLSGKYTQIQIENIPYLRGLSSAYGLTYIPGSWVESIDVSKGAGSIENSYEAMTGQINVRLKQTTDTDKLYLNAYGNSFGRSEINLLSGHRLSGKWSTSVLFHGNIMPVKLDGNNDGFLDRPAGGQINLMNRWKYKSDKVVGNWSIQVVEDEKNGGQKDFNSNQNHRTSPLYGIRVRTKKIDFFGKNGFRDLGKNEQLQAAVLYGINFTDLNSFYGRRQYLGKQTSAFVNGFLLTDFGDSKWKLKTGINWNYDGFDEQLGRLTSGLPAYDFSRNETVYGAYAEFTNQLTDNLTWIASSRFDYNTVYGSQFTPRLHLKLNLDESTVLRANAGKGTRTPNPVAENTQVLVSSRELHLDEKLKQEVSWNFGGSLQKEFTVFGEPATFLVDYYYTYFTNQLVTDLDTDPNKVFFRNLDGKADAHSLQAELDLTPAEGLSVKTAYKYYNVQTTIIQKKVQVPFVPKHRLFLNLSYAFPGEKFRIDWTGQLYGEKRLPDTSAKPEAYRLGENSPAFFTMNAQTSYAISEKLEFYAGGENLTNYRQKHPIISPEQPFSKNFDASLNWGPITGIMAYAGVRWTIFK